MASRQQKFNKLLTNKKANLEQDIKVLEAEVAPYITQDLDAELINLSLKKETVTTDLQEVQLKISECEVKLLDAEKEYKATLKDCAESLEQEKEIYKAEMDRIDYIYDEWLTIQKEKKSSLIDKLASLTKNIECLSTQHHNLLANLENYKHVKRDIRADMLADLLDKQKHFKKAKQYHEQHTNHLSLLESTCTELTEWITNYPDARLKINRDYYDWLDEITNLKSVISHSASTPDLQQQLLKLEADPRQNYKLLFTELDDELVTKQRHLTRVQAQLNKYRQSGEQLDRPLLLPVRNQEHNDILQDNINVREDVNNICKDLETLKCNSATIIRELDSVNELLSITGYPAEINIWKERADERWAIINERLNTKINQHDQEYLKQRTELRDSLNALKKLEKTIYERASKNDEITGLTKAIETKKQKLAKLEELRGAVSLLESAVHNE